MEFHITMTGQVPEIGAIEQAIRTVDPSALVDIDPASGILRVAAWVDADQLVSLISQAGCPADRQQVKQIPSICCGGCSG